MRRFFQTIFLLGLSSCVYEDHLILREPVPLERRRPQNGLYKKASFWDLARTVEQNAPTPNQSITRKGVITFSTKKIQRVYSFDYGYNTPQQWKLILYEKNSQNRLFSLHRNHLGLTMQDVQDQLFQQSYEEDIWELLAKHPWFFSLQSVLISMEAPSFRPELDWQEQVDGLKYYVISRVEQAHDPKDAIKHEIYLHKKAKTIARHIKSRLNLGIVEYTRYRKYRAVEQFYLPQQISIEQPKSLARVDINIESTELSSPPLPPTLLREL